MKRIFAVLLTALLLTGCSGSSSSSNSQAAIVGGGSADITSQSQAESAASHTLDEANALNVNDDVINIGDKLFIAQTNEIYLNYQDYLGKTIHYEGIYMQTEMEGYDPWNYVVRYGPGCCSNDGTAGFEVSYDGEWPEQFAWVEIDGVLETYEINGWQMLILNITSMTEKEERGQEYVTA